MVFKKSKREKERENREIMAEKTEFKEREIDKNRKENIFNGGFRMGRRIGTFDR